MKKFSRWLLWCLLVVSTYGYGKQDINVAPALASSAVVLGDIKHQNLAAQAVQKQNFKSQFSLMKWLCLPSFLKWQKQILDSNQEKLLNQLLQDDEGLSLSSKQILEQVANARANGIKIDLKQYEKFFIENKWLFDRMNRALENIRKIQRSYKNNVHDILPSPTLQESQHQHIDDFKKMFKQGVMHFLSLIYTREEFKQKIWAVSDEAQKKDLAVYQVFEHIKNDFRIREHVDFRIAKSRGLFAAFKNLFWPSKSGVIAWYNPGIRTVMLNHDYYKSYSCKYPPRLVFTLAHELEHHRQFCGYSCNDLACKYKNRILGRDQYRKILECRADTAACKYIKCYDCLCDIQKIKDVNHRLYPDGNGGWLSTPKGYLSSKDLQCYIDHAFAAGTLCPAHAAQKNMGLKKQSLDQYLPC